MEGENLIIRCGDAEREWPRPTVRRRALPSPVSLRVRMGAVVDLHHVFDGELRVALRVSPERHTVLYWARGAVEACTKYGSGCTRIVEQPRTATTSPIRL